MSSVVEQIKSKLSIVDVVGSYLKLERAGSNFKARCPFHNEKTASFFVSPSRETYHCFGCNRGGDLLSFIEEIEGFSFRDALKLLADRAGVRLTETDPSIDREREKIFSVLEAATVFFSHNLSKHKEASDYLRSRSVTDETIQSFRLGYAPAQWRALTEFLQNKGFAVDILEKAGLVIKNEKDRSTASEMSDTHAARSVVRGYYDRFRDRVMFPIADNFGRIVGFSGRILPRANDTQDKSQAKYVNSPETEVFHKSRILYGFDKAKQAIRKQNAAVLVEGQMDLVLSHQARVAHTVASSGTALTKDHLVLLKRLADTLIIAFDADEAGLSAGKKGVDLALREGFDVRVAAIPMGLDPADVIRKNPGDWEKCVEHAQHIIDFYLKALSGKGYDMRVFRKKTSELVLPYIAQLGNTIDQAHFVGETARALHIPEAPIWEELKKISRSEASVGSADEYGEHTENSLPQGERRQKIERKVLGILFWQEHVKKSLVDREKLTGEYRMIVGDDDFKIMQNISPPEKNDLMFEAEIYYQDIADLPQEIELLLANLEEEVLKEKFVTAMDELRNAELKGDVAHATEILKTCQEISKKLSGIVKK